MEASRTRGAARRRVAMIVGVVGLAVLGTPVVALGATPSGVRSPRRVMNVPLRDHLAQALRQPNALGAQALGVTLSQKQANRIATLAVNQGAKLAVALQRKLRPTGQTTELAAHEAATAILNGKKRTLKVPGGQAIVVPGDVAEALNALLPVFAANLTAGSERAAKRPAQTKAKTKKEIAGAIRTRAKELAEPTSGSGIGF
ncbi:MAG: hypothetical protein IPL40_12745 [Proteobacteria bacterium]|nr:hypothetical protein [Pseudomonadota bacterium]